VWRPNGKRAAVVGDIEMVCMDRNKVLRPIPEDVLSVMGMSS